MEHTKPLKKRDFEALPIIDAVIDGKTIVTTSQEFGISRGKVYRLIQNEKTQQLLQQCYESCVDRIRYRLPDLVNEALGTLNKAMIAPHTVGKERLEAAKIVLEHVDKIGGLLKA